MLLHFSTDILYTLLMWRMIYFIKFFGFYAIFVLNHRKFDYDSLKKHIAVATFGVAYPRGSVLAGCAPQLYLELFPFHAPVVRK